MQHAIYEEILFSWMFEELKAKQNKTKFCKGMETSHRPSLHLVL